MGCCESKDDESKQASDPLIPREGPLAYDPPRMPFPRYDAIAEQESLQKIVQRTAENIIDISNTHITERIQQQDAIDRANDYMDLISSIKLDSKSLQKIQEKSNTLPKLYRKKSRTLMLSQQAATPDAQGGITDLPPHVVLSSAGVTKEEQEWLTESMKDIHKAIEHIEVEYIGDLVVPLTWSNPAPTHAVHD